MKSIELRQLSDEELKQKINESEEELFNLRFKKSFSPVENPKRFNQLKKIIARAKTILTERNQKKENNK